MNFRATLDMFRITRDLPVETLDVAWLLLPQCFELARIAVDTVVGGGAEDIVCSPRYLGICYCKLLFSDTIRLFHPDGSRCTLDFDFCSRNSNTSERRNFCSSKSFP